MKFRIQVVFDLIYKVVVSSPILLLCLFRRLFDANHLQRADCSEILFYCETPCVNTSKYITTTCSSVLCILTHHSVSFDVTLVLSDDQSRQFRANSDVFEICSVSVITERYTGSKQRTNERTNERTNQPTN